MDILVQRGATMFLSCLTFLLLCSLVYNRPSSFQCHHPEYVTQANYTRDAFNEYRGQYTDRNLDDAFRCLQSKGEVSKDMVLDCFRQIGEPDVNLAQFFNRQYPMTKQQSIDLTCCVAEKVLDGPGKGRSEQVRTDVYKKCLADAVSQSSEKEKRTL